MVEQESPSKLTFIMPSTQGERPLRLEVNLPQVDSLLDKLARASLKETHALRTRPMEFTPKPRLAPTDHPRFTLRWKKGKFIGEIVVPNQKAQGMVRKALPQIKRALSQMGVEVDGLRVTSLPPQKVSTRTNPAKTPSSNLEFFQQGEVKIGSPSQPIKGEIPLLLNHPSPPPSHPIKGLDAIIDKLIGKLKVNLQEGRSEAKVTLKPDYLGHLQIKLTLEGKNIVGKILVDNPLAKDLIQGSLPQLKDSLANLGVEVQDFEVSVGGKNPSPQRRPTSPAGRKHSPFTDSPMPSAGRLYPLLRVNMATQGGVDYLA